MRRLVCVAALFHVTLAVLLFAAGRLELAPRFVNRDGIAPASDSLIYQQAARERGAWRNAAVPPHVRLLSLLFTLFGRLTGYGSLAAEPLNLVCYLAVVSLTYAIGRDVGGGRPGIVAAAVIGLWPTFVFHTLQLLKEPLFITGTLSLVFIAVTWLTRTYDWKQAAGAGMAMMAAASPLLLMRSKFAAVIVVLAVLGAGLLLVRQLREKRFLPWNVTSALLALLAAAVALSHSERTYERVKVVPSPVRGQSKSLAGGRIHVPTAVAWSAAGAPASLALGKVRSRYIANDRVTGSGIDDQIELRHSRELIAYLPRAAAIGLWAPFPSMWAQSGRTVGRTGRLLAGVETLAIYALELLSIAALLLRPQRLPALLLLLFAALGVTMLAVVVTNAGTLYRFRYPFWILLIVTGISGGEKAVRAWRPGDRRRAAGTIAACLSLLALSCAHTTGPRLSITNLTGSTIDALYLSPNGSATWEENVLGQDVLRDGDTVAIRFDSRVPAPLWDLRLDSGPYRAVWLRLERNRITTMVLRIQKNVAVAEVR